MLQTRSQHIDFLLTRSCWPYVYVCWFSVEICFGVFYAYGTHVDVSDGGGTWTNTISVNENKHAELCSGPQQQWVVGLGIRRILPHKHLPAKRQPSALPQFLSPNNIFCWFCCRFGVDPFLYTNKGLI